MVTTGGYPPGKRIRTRKVIKMTYQYTLNDAMTDLRGDVILLRLCLQGLLSDAKGCQAEKLCCLWRLSDHLEQHVGEVEQLIAAAENA